VAREQRKLAAILAADVVGYSRLMGRDESGTLARLRKARAGHLDSVLTKYGGRLVKLTGDGALIEFVSAVDALSAAIEFQQRLSEANSDQPADTALVFRMGLHLGDLIVDGDDLYGDGVNIAARLEAEAPAGGIVISRTVHEAVTGRVDATFEDLGNLVLKNIERPVQAFSVQWERLDWQPPVTPEVMIAAPGAPQVPLSLPDKPSIAVLPFQNLSGDPEQEYFVDGLVEDIITALSRFKSLFVIARNSSFTYKGKAVDIKQVGRELGVRYVLEGSIRKATNRVRISGQLIESETGTHVWADRFDGALEDVFTLQDVVTEKVIAALAPSVEQAEIERTKRKPTTNLGAYDCYLKGLAVYQPLSRENLDEATTLFRRAVELDPEHSSALGMLLSCYVGRRAVGILRDVESENAEVERLVRRAIRIGRDDAVALGHTAIAIASILRDLAFAQEQVKRALTLNPNLANAWTNSGWINLWSGDPGTAIQHLSRSIRLDPMGIRGGRASALASAYFFLDRHQEALQWAEGYVRASQSAHAALRIATASAAFAGMTDQAQMFAARLIEVDPAFRVSRLQEYLGPYRLPEFVEKYQQGLRLAGLPE
jgi:TolB-like protein/class 3 adenylate cyclase/Tfp pilus assembly protein PilF